MFIRSYLLKAGKLIIDSNQTPLELQFNISSTITSEADEFTINIYNLSETSRALIKAEYDNIELYAGYSDTSISLIAKGELRSVFNRRSGTEIITEINAGSGDKAIQKGKLNKTFNKKEKVTNIIKEIVSKMENTTIGRIDKDLEIELDKTNFTIATNAKRALDKLAKRIGFDWWIENQTFNALLSQNTFKDTYIISVETGLIGSPRETERGVIVETLLNPNIRIGSLIRVISRDVNRTYKIVGYTHSGSFYSGDWKTQISGERLDLIEKEKDS